MNDFQRDKCRQIISNLKENQLASTFILPIDTTVLPDYDTIIQKKLSLSEIESNLLDHKIKSLHEFRNDTLLVFDNCIKYWTRRAKEEKREPAADVYVSIASTLKDEFLKTFNGIPTTRENEWLLNVTKLAQQLADTRAILVKELNSKMQNLK
ncbi:Bromodomain containing protein [Trichomonas vaginalis G3]|uniref:Bromodomain containing protein n=1 Tax=Trichomonas vaginalis (strain ATCC PRA-98 / G3) TaxID=412133 RepID=A2DJH6_TRIV3|nr:bromodomain family [Trichomonas vaginalis G3]EAY19376.1 Bromodomain containing protein [Trichomonas vaginalis G3]KAI5493230.1 bromodomain family [Trichomonas vaginalis G3]|eukprot:XP_001580362.1 Bromodomain containing protein [Trichomonas vaginalis G3]